MEQRNWKCPKCENETYETGRLTATAGGFSKFFNIQSNKYTSVTCNRCKYTEFYKGTTSTAGNVLDFFGN